MSRKNGSGVLAVPQATKAPAEPVTYVQRDGRLIVTVHPAHRLTDPAIYEPLHTELTRRAANGEANVTLDLTNVALGANVPGRLITLAWWCRVKHEGGLIVLGLSESQREILRNSGDACEQPEEALAAAS